MHARNIMVLLMAVLTSLGLFAQEDTKPDPDETRFQEQTIYIPYNELEKIFEKKGRGVFIPYEEYRKLWETSRNLKNLSEENAPVQYQITSFNVAFAVNKSAITGTGKVNVAVYKHGWHKINLNLAGSALSKATINGQAATITGSPQSGYQLVYFKKYKSIKPEQIELDLELSHKITTQAAQNSFQITPPVATICHWEVQFKRKNTRLEITPVTSRTEINNDTGTLVKAFTNSNSPVKFVWHRRAEEAVGLKALLDITTNQTVNINKGVIRTAVDFQCRINRSRLAEFEVIIPENEKVINVHHKDLLDWSLNKDLLTIKLVEPVDGIQHFTLELERFAEVTKDNVVIPAIQAANGLRRQGVVAVTIAKDLRAENIIRSRMNRLDSHDNVLRYSYSSVPASLTMQLRKVEPRSNVTEATVLSLFPEKMILYFESKQVIRDAGIFAQEFIIPNGMKVRSVSTFNDRDTMIANWEQYEPTKLKVNFKNKTTGTINLAIKCEKYLQSQKLHVPGQGVEEIPFTLPVTSGDYIEQRSGTFAITGKESLRINTSKVKELRTISVSNLNRLSSLGSQGRPAFSYAYENGKPELVLEVERRLPEANMFQMMVCNITSGLMSYKVDLQLDVKYSGIRNFRIDVPDELQSAIRIVTPGIQQVTAEKENLNPAVPEGYTAWILSGENEFLGKKNISLKWETAVADLEIGKPKNIRIPRIIPQKFNRSAGQLIISKNQSIEVNATENKSGVRPIDPEHDIAAKYKSENAARAFEFHDDWNLEIKAIRFESKEVIATAIEKALVRVVKTKGESMGVQCIYRLKSGRQRITVKLPEGVSFDIQPVRINDRPIPLEQGKDNTFFIPLAGHRQDEELIFELRYSLDNSKKIELPLFVNEPAIQKTYLMVYVPDNIRYLGFSGPWSENLYWSRSGFESLPVPQAGLDTIFSELTQRTGISINNIKRFETAGYPLQFTCMGNKGGDSSMLKLCLTPKWLLNLIVSIIIIVVGIGLTRFKFSKRLIAIGVIISFFILSGIFAPTFVKAICCTANVTAVAIVILVWIIQGLLTLNIDADSILKQFKPTPKPKPAPKAKKEVQEEGDNVELVYEAKKEALDKIKKQVEENNKAETEESTEESKNGEDK